MFGKKKEEPQGQTYTDNGQFYGGTNPSALPEPPQQSYPQQVYPQQTYPQQTPQQTYPQQNKIVGRIVQADLLQDGTYKYTLVTDAELKVGVCSIEQ